MTTDTSPLSSRLGLLFSALHPKSQPEQATTAVARAVTQVLGRPTDADHLDAIRRGDLDDNQPLSQEDIELLSAIAAHFGVDASYLTVSEDTSQVTEHLRLWSTIRDADDTTLAFRQVQHNRPFQDTNPSGIRSSSATAVDSTDFLRLHKRCVKMADRIRLPRPFEIASFIQNLADHLGKPIELIGMTIPNVTPLGMLVDTPEISYIFYPCNTTQLHQMHTIMHEAGHLIWGHPGASLDTLPRELLTNDLPHSLIDRVIGHSDYSAAQEAEAETLASIILLRADRSPRLATDPSLADGMQRLRSVFG